MFKVGDKVRNVSETRETWNGGDGPIIGATYTVDRVSGCGSYIGFAEFRSRYPSHARMTTRYELIEQGEKPGFDLLSAMTGRPLKFRSGCDVKFIAYSPDAKPHCQLVLLNPSTGNIVTRYANGKASDEPHNDPGDILAKDAA
ncbi:hypothetical protein [Burkholderia diffusa]|uniref:hypothetical protein n=1 Tax=Burkholderia diffusa TaxID=488732 RepID=UPI0020C5C764|nr:hypothetical protein [Burkholderia diffusa]